MSIKIEGLSKKQIHEIITKVAKNHRSKSFGSYTSDDIENQSWIIALEKLSEFNPSRRKTKDLGKSLEHWLNAVVARRLANFYRDKYLVPLQIKKRDVNPGLYRDRQNLFYPKSINDVGDLIESSHNFEDGTFFSELLSYLTTDEKDILDSLLSGETLNAYYKSKIIRRINEFMVIYGRK